MKTLIVYREGYIELSQDSDGLIVVRLLDKDHKPRKAKALYMTQNAFINALELL